MNILTSIVQLIQSSSAAPVFWFTVFSMTSIAMITHSCISNFNSWSLLWRSLIEESGYDYNFELAETICVKLRNLNQSDTTVLISHCEYYLAQLILILNPTNTSLPIDINELKQNLTNNIFPETETASAAVINYLGYHDDKPEFNNQLTPDEQRHLNIFVFLFACNIFSLITMGHKIRESEALDDILETVRTWLPGIKEKFIDSNHKPVRSLLPMYNTSGINFQALVNKRHKKAARIAPIQNRDSGLESSDRETPSPTPQPSEPPSLHRKAPINICKPTASPPSKAN